MGLLSIMTILPGDRSLNGAPLFPLPRKVVLSGARLFRTAGGSIFSATNAVAMSRLVSGGTSSSPVTVPSLFKVIVLRPSLRAMTAEFPICGAGFSIILLDWALLSASDYSMPTRCLAELSWVMRPLLLRRHSVLASATLAALVPSTLRIRWFYS